MKPVNQTRLGDCADGGNCFPACVASLFELPIEEVPDILPGSENWDLQWQAWLDKYALTFIEAKWPQPDGYTIGILSVGTEEEPKFHAVVCFAGEIVHDPDPFADTSKYPTEFPHIILVCTNPVRR